MVRGVGEDKRGRLPPRVRVEVESATYRMVSSLRALHAACKSNGPGGAGIVVPELQRGVDAAAG